jgi:hypothetical protein
MNYHLKLLGDEKNMQLRNLEEINGILSKIEFQKNEGIVCLTFTFKKKIDLPINASDKDFLISSLGKKIAIIRIDNDIKIKTIENEKE